jgi:hypothetical protein
MTFRPPQWRAPQPQTIVIVFPGIGGGQGIQQGQVSVSSPDIQGLPSPNVQGVQATPSPSGSLASLPAGPTSYVFDCVITAEHQQEVRRTEHPVQGGANISDHAYIVPARLVLDVGMSDAMDSYFNPSTWTGSQSKSVSAYQTMLALEFARIPFQISTRLRQYSSMIVESLSPQETYKTTQGVRMRVEFGQILTANVNTPANSARPMETNSTDLGTKSPQPPSAAQVAQNSVSTDQYKGPVYVGVPGAGGYSSVNVINGNSLPAPK